MDRILAWYRVTSSVGAVVALVVANLIPLAGALWLGWNVWTILIVYWLENGIVGVVNVLKMLKAEGVPSEGSATVLVNGRPAGSMVKAGLIPFFILHYGMFWVGHGIFVLVMPVFGWIGQVSGGPGPDMTVGFDIGTIVVAVVALAISHAASYRFNFVGKGEYRRVSPAAQMFAPYGRLVILHITVILGGMAVSLLGTPTAALAILVVLKIVLDLGFHLAEHRRAAAGPVMPPGTVVDAAPGD